MTGAEGKPLDTVFGFRSAARLRIEALVGRNVYLEVRARVRYAPEHARRRLREEIELRRLRRSGPTAPTGPDVDITVVCSTYRRPEKLARAIRSVLAQRTTRTWNLVVVDDGGGLSIGDLPNDPRIRYLSLGTRTGGPAVPRNVGARLTRSRLLAFIDDDNEWMPDHLEVLADAMASSDAVFAYSQMAVALGAHATRAVAGRPFDRSLLRTENYIDTNCLMVRRGRGVRFSTMPRYPLSRYWVGQAEDWELAFRLSRWHRKVAFVSEVTVRYEADGASYYRGTVDESP